MKPNPSALPWVGSSHEISKIKNDVQSITNGNRVSNELLLLNQITNIPLVKMTRNNYWLIELTHGDAAYDKTAKFQLITTQIN